MGSPAYALAVRTLTKKDIETLMSTYDADPVGSLCVAIGAMLGESITQWSDLMTHLPPSLAQSPELSRQDIAAMDSLVKLLVERRTL
ncbi:unannotated protein [freshwater metagenome]|uniref:Unannotated protein n=1 Tax=freshwater metagenome TaxID=449393 RepID=A0A6J6MQ79_9ZZZZ